MVTDSTIRVSLRLKNDIHAAMLIAAAEKGAEPAAFMQEAIQTAVYAYLTPQRQTELENEEMLYAVARKKAQQLFDSAFDEHFTLTVIRALMADEETRSLYEAVIGAPYLADGVAGKSPVNMYLGWYIKNAVAATPILDENGKPRRAFVKGEAVKSYTLLKKSE